MDFGSLAKLPKLTQSPHLQLQEADLATQARITAASVGQTLQTGTRSAAENLNRFIDEGGRGARAPRADGRDGVIGASSGAKREGGGIEPERKDFWDSFGDPTPKTSSGGSGGSAIGTAAMRKGGGGAAAGGSGSGSGGKDDGGWAGGDDW